MTATRKLKEHTTDIITDTGFDPCHSPAGAGEEWVRESLKLGSKEHDELKTPHIIYANVNPIKSHISYFYFGAWCKCKADEHGGEACGSGGGGRRGRGKRVGKLDPRGGRAGSLTPYGVGHACANSADVEVLQPHASFNPRHRSRSLSTS